MTRKVLVLASDTFAPDLNGTAVFTKHLAVAMQLQDVDVHVIAPATSKLYGTFREKHDGVPIIVHRLKSHRLPFQPSQRFVSPLGLTGRISGLLEQIRPDIVHIQSHINVGHHAAMAAKKMNLKLVATNHVDAESLIENTLVLPRFLKSYLRRILLADSGRVMRLADVVTTPSAKASQLLSQATGLANVLSISGGVNNELYAKLPKAKQSDKSLVYVGRLDREKHVYVLLEALAALPKEFPVSLTVVGTGSQLSELKMLARDLKLEKRVSFTGEISDSEVIDELGKASVFVMPSTQELQSLATLEALAAGRPVIAADAMALPSLVVDGQVGYLFKADSVSDLAEKIQKIFSVDNESFAKMAGAARELSESHDLSDTVAKYMEIYFGEQPLGTARDIKPILGSVTLGRAANGVLERLDGARGQVLETFTDARFTILRTSKRARRKISSSLRKALNQIRKGD